MSCSKKQKLEDGDVKEEVKNYYGKKLHKTEDLQSNACAFSKSQKVVPQIIRDCIKLCHEDVVSRYYGCGLNFPECLEGCRVLDLGCGAGRDCFITAKLVGPKGHVTGIDMTQDLLDIANEYSKYHAEKFGYTKPNTDFILGDIEELAAAGVKKNAYDLIISNCVICLTTNKKAVFEGAYRALKDGGELYFSDIYADRQRDTSKCDKALWGEGFCGALCWRELVDFCKDIGFSGPYLVTGHEMFPSNEEMKEQIGETRFVSGTYRMFKTPTTEDTGNTFQATYKGTIEGLPNEYKFDIYNTFEKDKAHPITPNLAAILRQSRFSKHFDIGPYSGRDAYAIADPFTGLGL
ncbi:arsenite methyltransferase-like [Actinia tenebrosa]|uniref:Arsenite methyltransferase n=1 Tax=Actinia tenebrosa TaxID=6105 RepID=A0A6P8HJL2_ACTTE|nr:arsenite methyltransferase-like [Actinia tenebrosa]